jgi:hypothetical protein
MTYYKYVMGQMASEAVVGHDSSTTQEQQTGEGKSSTKLQTHLIKRTRNKHNCCCWVQQHAD